MFAVPGWSVSAASLQTQKAPTQQTASKSVTDTDGAISEGAHKSSKKRKRSRDKPKSNGVVVTSENFTELWARHIEGGGTTKEPNESIKSKKKRQKTESDQQVSPSGKELGHQDGISGAREGGQDVESKVSNSKAAKSKKAGKRQHEEELNEHMGQNGVKPRESSEAAYLKLGDSSPNPRKTKTLKEKKREKKAAQQTPTTSTPATQPTTETNSNPRPKTATTQLPSIPPPPPLAPSTQLTPLQASMRSKLTSARFRHLNQTLYTTPSTTSISLFEQNPSMFADYHAGFRQQVSVWPSNPVDGYISILKIRGAVRRPGSAHGKGKKAKKTSEDSEGGLQPLPRTDGVCIVADLGCGDARLAMELNKSGVTKKFKLKTLSFDLQSENKEVTKADIACLPLENGSVDIAIFCLALMGTNWIDFIEEAWRVLHWKGELWVAEIKSRFGRIGGTEKRVEHSVGNKKKLPSKADKKAQETEDENAELAVEVDGVESGKGETDVSAFLEVMRKRGFVLQSEGAVDLSNKMFVKMGFVKALTPVRGKCVPEDKGVQAKEGETWKRKVKTKFLDEGEGAGDDEAKILKPCVYKLR